MTVATAIVAEVIDVILTYPCTSSPVVELVREPPMRQYDPICPTVEPELLKYVEEFVADKVMMIDPAVADGVIVIAVRLSGRYGPPRKSKSANVHEEADRRVSFLGG